MRERSRNPLRTPSQNPPPPPAHHLVIQNPPWPCGTCPTAAVVNTLHISLPWEIPPVTHAGAGEGAEAAPVSRGTTVPLSPTENAFSRRLHTQNFLPAHLMAHPGTPRAPFCGVHYLWFAFACYLIRSPPPPPPPSCTLKLMVHT